MQFFHHLQLALQLYYMACSSKPNMALLSRDLPEYPCNLGIYILTRSFSKQSALSASTHQTALLDSWLPTSVVQWKVASWNNIKQHVVCVHLISCKWLLGHLRLLKPSCSASASIKLSTKPGVSVQTHCEEPWNMVLLMLEKDDTQKVQF